MGETERAIRRRPEASGQVAPLGSERITAVLDQLESLAVELVAVTNAAIAETAAGDLTFPQWRLIMVLGSAPGPLRLHEIARRVSASMPSASRLVERMQRQGLVISAPDPVDGRGRRISLTDRGVEIRALVTARRRALIEQSLVGLEPPVDVGEALGRIIEGLRGRS